MRKAGRRKYRFLNEPYLYKLTHYSFYKRDQIHDIWIRIKKTYKESKYGFNLSDDQIDLFNNHVRGI